MRSCLCPKQHTNTSESLLVPIVLVRFRHAWHSIQSAVRSLSGRDSNVVWWAAGERIICAGIANWADNDLNEVLITIRCAAPSSKRDNALGAQRLINRSDAAATVPKKKRHEILYNHCTSQHTHKHKHSPLKYSHICRDTSKFDQGVAAMELES